jgi:hypothetical protein
MKRLLLINFLCREKFVMPVIPEELFGRASKCIPNNGLEITIAFSGINI